MQAQTIRLASATFASVDALLRWAYAMEGRPVIARSHVFASGGRGYPPSAAAQTCPDWNVWDRHAQAAQVRAQVERLGDPLAAFGVAVYGRFACAHAVRRLVTWAAPESPGLSLAYEMMVAQYVCCAGRHGIGDIRRELGCSKLAALAERRRIFDRLDGLRARLFDALDGPLTERAD